MATKKYYIRARVCVRVYIYIVVLTANDIHPSCINNKIVKEGICTTGSCFHANQINESTIENCTDPGTYDFFSNSSVSFIFTFLGVSTLFCGKNLLLLLRSRDNTIYHLMLIFMQLILTQVLLH